MLKTTKRLLLIIIIVHSSIAQMNTIIDIGGETTKVAVYGEKKNSFRYITTINEDYFEPTIVACSPSGGFLIGDDAKKREEHKGFATMQYPFLYNEISKERHISNIKKRFNLVLRSGDGIRLIGQYPLNLRIGKTTTSFAFIISTFVDEIVDDLNLNTQSIQTDFPLVLGIPSFYNPSQVDGVLYAFPSIGGAFDTTNTGENNNNNVNILDKVNTGKDDIEKLENDLKEIEDDMKGLNENDVMNMNDNLQPTKKTKKSKEKSKTTTDDILNDLDGVEYRLNAAQRDNENINEVGIDKNTENEDNQMPDYIKVIPNHLVHALSYFETQHNKENNPSNLPIVVLEFGASYFRGTKFQINDEKTIKLLQHEVSFAINTRKINHALLVLLLNKKTDHQSVLSIIQSYTPTQTIRMWKEVDEIRVKLSTSKSLVTEFMGEKVLIDQSDLEEVLVNEISEINELLQQLSGDDSLVYLTGGLSYTPILRKQVENVFGTYSSEIGNEQLLEGMKLFGVLHPLNGAITSTDKLPIIEDILPFGLYVEMDGSKKQLLERNHQFSGFNKEIVEFVPSKPQTISLCMEDVGGSEYDVDNCFQRYKVNGKVQITVVPINQGLIQQIIVENGGIIIENGDVDEVTNINGVDGIGEVEKQNRIRRKIEYQKELKELLKRIESLGNYPDLINAVYDELKGVDNEVLYEIEEINIRKKELMEYIDSYIEAVNKEVEGNKNEKIGNEEPQQKPTGQQQKATEQQQKPTEQQQKPIEQQVSSHKTLQQLTDEGYRIINSMISMISNNPTLFQPLRIKIYEVETKINNKNITHEDIQNLVQYAKQIKTNTQPTSFFQSSTNYILIFGAAIAIIILICFIIFFIHSRSFGSGVTDPIRER
ncbi:hypothetical protein QTN25_007029 [Entamoeba marina]